ncbi:ATP-dependent nuclease [Marinifilum flexuosum]|uniref:ATP-dependent nuclease n=1 Tax=Marinifilum flexuosum TaxID=1117708 RepID=UPI0024935BA0|nr:AAA family ATPase [Marinifilum flexuosum]
MYLSELKIWNFRKYGLKEGDKIENAQPGLEVKFKKGVNVLVGENDSGKTAIIDAIRYVLKTQSQEFIQWEDKDFYKEKGAQRSDELKIECTFSGFSAADAGHFLEWIGFDEDGKYKLKIWLTAKRKDNHIYPKVSAGVDLDGTYMEGEARDLLRVIYLKPLRDALTDMTHGRKSRLAQILKNLEAFKIRPDENGKSKQHKLEEYHDDYSKKVSSYFREDKEGKELTNTVNGFLTKDFLFKDEERKAGIKIDKDELSEILRDLDLILEENKSGLGSLNLLCMAAELLYLSEKQTGLKLTLIEELEAHLHPQYQLRMIDFIENNQDKYGQFILTTHSTTLASKIDLEKLIICRKENGVFPMGHEHTQLEEGDYQFLKRFLDATKANLFFARGVIVVEGDAENLLIPTIAEIIGRPLHEFGVSVVNVGSTAFKRYAKIFLRKDKDDNEDDWLDINVAVISDLDIRSIEYYEDKLQTENHKSIQKPKVWLITNENCKDFENITNEVDWHGVQNKVCSSESEMKKIIKLHEQKEKKQFKGKKIQEKIDKQIKECSIDIDEKIIDTIRVSKKATLESRLDIQNNRIFLPHKWTLEYDIACSGLAPYLEEANDMANTLKRNENIVFSSDDIKSRIADIKIEKVYDDQKTYDLFKPLNDGVISKAVTAQCLAMLLEKDKETAKNLIQGDKYLEYICNAIYHVTAPAEKGEKDE